MGRKKRRKVGSDYPKNKYAPSKPLVEEKDLLTVLRTPVIPSSNHYSNTAERIQIINGVVCSTGRYSRLYEDYDDK